MDGLEVASDSVIEGVFVDALMTAVTVGRCTIWRADSAADTIDVLHPNLPVVRLERGDAESRP